MLRRTEREASLAHDLGERAQERGATGRPINAIAESERPLATILDEWRSAERALAAADPCEPQIIARGSRGAAQARGIEDYKIAHERRHGGRR